MGSIDYSGIQNNQGLGLVGFQVVPTKMGHQNEYPLYLHHDQVYALQYDQCSPMSVSLL